MSDEKGIPMPPCSLPAMWRANEIGPMVAKIVGLFEDLKFAEAAELCGRMATKAKQAQALFKRAAVESKHLLEGSTSQKSFIPHIDGETGEVMNEPPDPKSAGQN